MFYSPLYLSFVRTRHSSRLSLQIHFEELVCNTASFHAIFVEDKCGKCEKNQQAMGKGDMISLPQAVTTISDASQDRSARTRQPLVHEDYVKAIDAHLAPLEQLESKYVIGFHGN